MTENEKNTVPVDKSDGTIFSEDIDRRTEKERQMSQYLTESFNKALSERDRLRVELAHEEIESEVSKARERITAEVMRKYGLTHDDDRRKSLKDLLKNIEIDG